MKIEEKAKAKINLFLDVIGRRQDGYHLLKMVMQDIAVYDAVEISDVEDGIILTGSTDAIPWDHSNLAYRAAEMFRRHFNINKGVRIHIDKCIPIAAGLAGGSADAAAVLRGLNKLWQVGATLQELKDIALGLGADVPYCVEGGTALAEGIGEHIVPLPAAIQGGWLVLAVPPIPVSTASVYRQWDELPVKPHAPIEPLIEAIDKSDLVAMGKHLFNALEAVTAVQLPIIGDIKGIMERCGSLGSCMSGSGPSVFGIFEYKDEAEAAADRLKAIIPDNNIFVVPLVAAH